jgi:lipopolysaccharide transport system ATP-binding protein
MQVRLAFSTAIQTDPDLLLVDEVLAVGDMEFQQKCFDVFSRYKKEGVTILFVSHDLGAVRRFCDKTLFLQHGEQVTMGETNRVIDEYIYKSEGSPKEQEKKPEEKKTRWGNMEVEIVGVSLLDKNGRENDNFIMGDPMTVRIYYYAKKRISYPVFGIVFYYQDTYCFGTTNEFRGYNLESIYGSGYIDFIIDKLPLMAGKFDLTIAIADTSYTMNYDWHDRLYSFHVHNPSRELGLFLIDNRWRTSKDD